MPDSKNPENKNEVLPVVILAGGLATRLRPLTETIPKSLVEVAGEPFLAHQLRLLERAGVGEVVICAGHLGDRIQDYAGDGSRFGLAVRYSFDGPLLRGTAGAIANALPLLPDRFLTLYGDSYLPIDYRAVSQAFVESNKPALMTVYRNEGQWDSSNVEFDGVRIIAYDKRARTPEMHYIDYGLGAFHRSVFEQIPQDQPYDLAVLYKALLAKGQLAAFPVEQRFYEIGSHAGIEELNSYLTLT